MAAATHSSFKTSDGRDIAYTLHPAPQAQAPRVALVHSLALDRSIWNGVVAQLAEAHICSPTIVADTDNRRASQ
jgi:3-oxoadipate enol-lactonase